MNFSSDILPFIPLFILFAAAIISLRGFKNGFPLYLKGFSLYWLLIFLIDACGHILTRTGSTSNHWLYNISNFITGIFIWWFYYHILRGESYKKLLLVIATIAATLLILNSFFLQSFEKLQTNNIVITGGFIMLLAAVYFWQLNQSDENIAITKEPLFWINFGLLFYHAATVPFFGMLNYLYFNYPEFTGIYFNIVTYGFSVFLNLCIIVAYLCRKNFQKSLSY